MLLFFTDILLRFLHVLQVGFPWCLFIYGFILQIKVVLILSIPLVHTVSLGSSPGSTRRQYCLDIKYSSNYYRLLSEMKRFHRSLSNRKFIKDMVQSRLTVTVLNSNWQGILLALYSNLNKMRSYILCVVLFGNR